MTAVAQQSSEAEQQPSIKNLFNSLIGTTFIPLAKLRPTQMTVGMKEVEQKQRRLQGLENSPLEIQKYFINHTLPVVLGPKGNAYIIDHHHLGVALLRDQYRAAPVRIDLDLSHLSPKKFWAKMVQLAYVHPHDENGVKQSLTSIPESLLDLKDDPYRSIAGFVRSAGGFDKVETPYAEFKWADFFRTRIPLKLVHENFDEAVKQALELASSKEAKKLPGYKSRKERERVEHRAAVHGIAAARPRPQ